VKIKLEIKEIEAQGHLLQTCYNWEIYVTAGKGNLLGGLPDDPMCRYAGYHNVDQHGILARLH
jgi:hypothetical protein